MKYSILLILFYLTYLSNKEQEVYIPKNGFVPNKEVAISVAEPILFHIYGKENILAQKPYNIELNKDGVWIITGWIDGLGGVFEIEIQKKDAKVLKVEHGK